MMVFLALSRFVVPAPGRLAMLVASMGTVLLAGCVAGVGGSGDTAVHDDIPPAHRDWFDGGQPVDMDSMDWGRIEFARQAAAKGDARRAVGILQPMMNEGFSPAYYEAGKLHEDGIGTPPDPAKAAIYYGKALRSPSNVLGNASLRLGRLYRDGQAVERNETLAYHLFRQAVDRDTGASALVALAEMLVEGRGVEANTEEAEALYSRAADLGYPQAFRALAEAHAPGGWLERDDQLVREYAQRYATGLEKQVQARADDQDALAALARLHDEDGLLGPRPDAYRHWLRRAAEAGHAGSLGKAGEIALEEGNVQHGLEMLRRSAEAGNVYAMTDLGRALLERDPARAEQWLQAAAEKGSVNAAASLGRAYLPGGELQADHRRARTWLSRASEGGHAGAAATLGRLYLRGDGVAQDTSRGVAYLERAVAQGHAGARIDLGKLLLAGDGVNQDTQRGISLLRSAAERGNADAAHSLGDAYLEGKGVEQDPRQAEKWLAQAVDAGNPFATYSLGRTHLYGEKGFEPNVARGRELLAQAAEQQHAGAQTLLGREYLRGELFEKDPDQGASYLYQAARQGHSGARLALAKAYLWANGLEGANQEQAVLWLDDILDGDSEVALATMRQLLTEADDKAVRDSLQ
ncbi:Sel1 repeat-containing protein [Modicisalibacter ilicicola DSM 19980]|uniref:Sel1 repeat-containing protein n=1 Tax=Modicisalibacter ilicicola DSM 19980 TaxID=1121942 RepID=A0A1M4SAU6_9GAMM|nr:tetratricopeptide repeat protein [Halomonas ilicicola]SHE29363.1 Sel1 repeat-containing protein [Halomonas ilicicola DSM 19980]